MKEAINFYKELLGQTATTLSSVGMSIMRKGRVLNRAQQIQVAAPVVRKEVKVTLQGIEDLKASGKDGLNVFFLQKAWSLVGRR